MAQTGEVVSVPQTRASVLPLLSNSLSEPLVTLWGDGHEHGFDLGKIPQPVWVRGMLYNVYKLHFSKVLLL